MDDFTLFLVCLGILAIIIYWPSKKHKRRYFTRDEVSNVFERYHHRCQDCGRGNSLSIHHIHPISRGGSNDLSNLTILCKSCNSQRGNR